MDRADKIVDAAFISAALLAIYTQHDIFSSLKTIVLILSYQTLLVLEQKYKI